jgi:hypothetical protein
MTIVRCTHTCSLSQQGSHISAVSYITGEHWEGKEKLPEKQGLVPKSWGWQLLRGRPYTIGASVSEASSVEREQRATQPFSEFHLLSTRTFLFLFYFIYFIIHTCIKGLGHFSPLPPPPPLPPTCTFLNPLFNRISDSSAQYQNTNSEVRNYIHSLYGFWK